MKRTLLTIAAAAAAVLTLTGCGTSLAHDRAVSIGFADFRPYISAGFWISPGQYNGKFEPIGELSIRIYPAIKATTEGDGVYMTTGYAPERIGADELLEIAYKAAKEKGANGIADYKTHIQGDGLAETYIITGLLINVLD